MIWSMLRSTTTSKRRFSKFDFLKLLSNTMTVSNLKWKNHIIQTNFAFLFKKLVYSSFPIFYKFQPPSLIKEGGVEIMCIHLKIHEIIFVSFCEFSLGHFDVFRLFLLLFSIFDMAFCKNVLHFYNHIKHKAEKKRFYPPTNNNNLVKTLQIKQT